MTANIAMGLLIAFVSFCLGWLGCAIMGVAKGNRRDQAQDDAEQKECLEQHNNAIRRTW